MFESMFKNMRLVRAEDVRPPEPVDADRIHFERTPPAPDELAEIAWEAMNPSAPRRPTRPPVESR